MIFPEYTTEDWIKKYPSLKQTKGVCDYCLNDRVATIPYVTKDTIGLVSPKCSCGKSHQSTRCFILKNSKEESEWKSLLGF